MVVLLSRSLDKVIAVTRQYTTEPRPATIANGGIPEISGGMPPPLLLALARLAEQKGVKAL
jgi:hypothetical protein